MAQFISLLSSCLFGLFLGICTVFVNLISETRSITKKSKSILINIFDILLYLFFGACFALFAYATNEGRIRWYTFFFTIATCILTAKILYKPINALKIKALFVIKTVSIFIKKRIIIPIVNHTVRVINLIFSPIKFIKYKLKYFADIHKIMNNHKTKYNSKSILSNVAFTSKIENVLNKD